MEPPWLEEDSMILSNDENILKGKELEKKIFSVEFDDYLPSPKIKTIKCSPLKHVEPVINADEKNTSLDSCCLDNISSVVSSPEDSSNSKGNQLDLNESFTVSINKDLSFEINGNDVKIINNSKEEIIQDETNNVNNLIKNIKDLLQTESSGQTINRKKLGESLINAFAAALNLDGLVIPQKSTIEQENKDKETQPCINKKSNAKDKHRNSIDKKVEPKLKAQPIKYPVNEKLQPKKLKLKCDNEKIGNRGPLKAIIPVKQMEKIKKSKLIYFYIVQLIIYIILQVSFKKILAL